MPNLVSITRPSLQILGKTPTGVFPISGFHNSRTSDDIDMKLGTVPKLDKRNTAVSKMFNHNVMSENCDVIVIILNFGKF